MTTAATFFQRTSGIAAAYAFGTVPEGRSHRESDLDLAVLLDWARHPDLASRAERQLELLSELLRILGTNRVDLIVLNDAPPLLARRMTLLVEPLVRLPGFRNVLLHEYVGFDPDRAVRALDEPEPVRRFVSEVARRERPPGPG